MNAVEIFKKYLEGEVLYFTEYRDSVLISMPRLSYSLS